MSNPKESLFRAPWFLGGDFTSEEEDLEHHFRLIGWPAKIGSISIPAKFIDTREVDCFIQELEEVIFRNYPVIDVAAIEGKLA